MKNKFSIIAGSLLAMITLTQCGKDCAKEVCDEPPSPVFSFRITNNANVDLVVGPGKVYDTGQVKISARRSNNGNLENIPRLFYIIKNGLGTADSICTTGLTVTTDYSIYYLSLNNAVTDSITFGYNKKETLCCDFSNFYLARFNTLTIPNGGTPLPITNGYRIIK